MTTTPTLPPIPDLSRIDATQAALHKGRQCFHVEKDGSFCGRADYWAGHGCFHPFLSLNDLVRQHVLAAYREGAANVIKVIANDAHAATFQSVGQYRQALLKIGKQT